MLVAVKRTRRGGLVRIRWRRAGKLGRLFVVDGGRLLENLDPEQENAAFEALRAAEASAYGPEPRSHVMPSLGSVKICAVIPCAAYASMMRRMFI